MISRSFSILIIDNFNVSITEIFTILEVLLLCAYFFLELIFSLKFITCILAFKIYNSYLSISDA